MALTLPPVAGIRFDGSSIHTLHLGLGTQIFERVRCASVHFCTLKFCWPFWEFAAVGGGFGRCCRLCHRGIGKRICQLGQPWYPGLQLAGDAPGNRSHVARPGHPASSQGVFPKSVSTRPATATTTSRPALGARSSRSRRNRRKCFLCRF